MPQEKYLECGKIINTHGVRGALKIESWCDSPEVLCDLRTLYYKKKDEFVELEVTKASVHKGCALVYFYGIDSMEAAQLLGLDCAGVLYGYGSKEELEAYPHVILAENADELKEFILK